MKKLSVVFALLALPAFAQSSIEVRPIGKFVQPPEVTEGEEGPETVEEQGFVEELITAERPSWRSVERPVAVLRGLDKISGLASDITVNVGDTVTYGRLTVLVEECREPPQGESEDAFVFMKVQDPKAGAEPVFSGWMFASSPALSAMDHQRYDLWVLSCATS